LALLINLLVSRSSSAIRPFCPKSAPSILWASLSQSLAGRGLRSPREQIVFCLGPLGVWIDSTSKWFVYVLLPYFLVLLRIYIVTTISQQAYNIKYNNVFLVTINSFLAFLFLILLEIQILPVAVFLIFMVFAKNVRKSG